MTATAEENLDGDWDIQGTLQFVKDRGSQVVALQFPDELLKHAATVVRRLQACCAAQNISAQVSIPIPDTCKSIYLQERLDYQGCRGPDHSELL